MGLAALPAAAQDLSAGYQWQRLSTGGVSGNYPFGVNLDASLPIPESTVSLIGQFDWSRKSQSGSTSNLSVVGGGLRWSPMASDAARPFVDAVAGLSHDAVKVGALTAAANDFFFQAGGGVTRPVTDAADWVLQADYRCLFSDPEKTHSVRVVIGVRIALVK
jgi:hypothetical protein